MSADAIFDNGRERWPIAIEAGGANGCMVEDLGYRAAPVEGRVRQRAQSNMKALGGDNLAKGRPSEGAPVINGLVVGERSRQMVAKEERQARPRQTIGHRGGHLLKQ